MLLLRLTSLALLGSGPLFLSCANTQTPAGRAALRIEAVATGIQHPDQPADFGWEWIDPSIDGRLLGDMPSPDNGGEAGRYLAVWSGRCPSTGYGLALASDQATVEGQVVSVVLEVIEPSQGMLNAQVVTHPFVLLRLPRSAPDRVSFVDAAGRALGGSE